MQQFFGGELDLKYPEYCTLFLRHLESERPPPYGRCQTRGFQSYHPLTVSQRLRSTKFGTRTRNCIGGSEPAIQTLYLGGVKTIQRIFLGWNEIFERGVVANKYIFLGHWLESPILPGVARSIAIILLRKRRLGLRGRAS